MKKIIIVICSILIVVFIALNLIPNTNNATNTDGLEINTSYLDDSTKFVSDMEFKGNLQNKKRLNIKTILQPNNTITIENTYSESGMDVIITDKSGEKVLSEAVKGCKELSFESQPGEGTVELLLNIGKHETNIKINEGVQND
ncbi:hypothetical protein MUB24_12655 [Lederbergia sp. NSJ-179]|uniref:hypothetical protein n=1 Tax=Lederbergia sp. NSJ-179 TaxID=2931402 RepID=UPI001FD03BAE|nr:hypothetical protein [Lederbergia sp. NSJ-179]MCJ7841732.1 hypothetical protein [Lederbergia sp. NSJ-179]